MHVVIDLRAMLAIIVVNKKKILNKNNHNSEKTINATKINIKKNNKIKMWESLKSAIMPAPFFVLA